jgi:formylglycine-generating enzyme required for sulfatase activity
MKKELWIQLAILLFLIVACSSAAVTSSPTKTPTATAVALGDKTFTATFTPEVRATPTKTLVMKILPTNTPVPPPPTPAPKPTSTPMPTPTPQPSPTALPTEQAGQITPQPTPTQPPTSTPVPEPGGAVGKEMVLVPGGEFTMGSNDGDPDEAPPHPVSVSPFWMDVTEVTNDEFAAFMQAIGYQAPAVVLGEGNHPVVRVTWDDANAYCAWAGGRLPTEAEWEFAARGTDGRVYPWGNDWDPAKSNGRETGIRSTTAVGSFGAGASPFGALDMAGNVREWTADWYDKYPGSSFSSQFFNRFRVHRGGGWFDDSEDLRAANRNGGPPETANDDLGFRCVKDANL